MKRVRRYDNETTLAKPERTPEGFLRAEAYTAKAGILLYDMPDGSVRRELVTPEVLFDAASIASAKMVPLTNRHPETLLTSETARAHQIGSVGENIRPDGDLLAAPIMVTDAATVRAIEEGRQEMSWGYECDLDETPGRHPKFGEYDVAQVDRRYNHLAIVDAARAGAQARIRLDAAGHAVPPVAALSQPVVASPSPTARTEPSMRIKIGEHFFELVEANGGVIQGAVDQLVAGYVQRIDASDKAKAAAETDGKNATKRLDGLKRRFVAVLSGVRGHLDAMKARMMGCDECGGSGKLDGEKNCDYCGGSGTVRMHDAIKEMPAAGESHPEEDLAAADAAIAEAEAAPEPAEGEPAPADKPKLDAAAKQRADARVAARKRRTDSLTRVAERRAVARAALLVEARKVLGDEAKFDGKDDLAVKRELLAKMAPHLDGVDKLPADAVELMLAAERKRADAAGPTDSNGDGKLTEGEKLRAAMLGNGAAAGRSDGKAKQKISKRDALENAWKNPTQQPTLESGGK